MDNMTNLLGYIKNNRFISFCTCRRLVKTYQPKLRKDKEKDKDRDEDDLE